MSEIDFKETELDVKSIFDVAFQVFLKNWQGVLLYVLALLVVVWAIQLPVLAWLSTQEALLEVVMVTGMELMLLQSLIVSLVSSTAILVFIPMIKRHLSGEPLGKQAYTQNYRKLPLYLASVACYSLALLTVLMIGLGLGMFIGGSGMSAVVAMSVGAGLYLMVCFSFYLHELSHTGTWGFKALLRSHALVRGRLFKTLLISMIGTVLGMMVLQITVFVRAQLGLGGLIGAFVSEYIALMVAAYVMLAMGVWYLNRNERWQAMIDARNRQVGQYE